VITATPVHGGSTRANNDSLPSCTGCLQPKKQVPWIFWCHLQISQSFADGKDMISSAQIGVI